MGVSANVVSLRTSCKQNLLHQLLCRGHLNHKALTWMEPTAGGTDCCWHIHRSSSLLPPLFELSFASSWCLLFDQPHQHWMVSSSGRSCDRFGFFTRSSLGLFPRQVVSPSIRVAEAGYSGGRSSVRCFGLLFSRLSCSLTYKSKFALSLATSQIFIVCFSSVLNL